MITENSGRTEGKIRLIMPVDRPLFWPLHLKYVLVWLQFNLFVPSVAFIYPQKTSENLAI